MRMQCKADLPQKICPECQRPFHWRKKWERDWPTVVYCSDRCRGAAKRIRQAGSNHEQTTL